MRTRTRAPAWRAEVLTFSKFFLADIILDWWIVASLELPSYSCHASWLSLYFSIHVNIEKFCIFSFMQTLRNSVFFHSCKHWEILKYPTGRKLSLELEFFYFANGKFTKFKLCILLHILKSLNDSLYDWNSNNLNLIVFIFVNLTEMSQVAKLNSVYISIL